MPSSASSVRPIRRALVSVYDKTSLLELGQALAAAGVEIVSTGSTASVLAAGDVAVTEVSHVTGFPECLDGRVKTLHPTVHAGILADLSKESHVTQLAGLGIEPFDLVVVNLYPFAETIAAGKSFAECVEMIDIGGPTMVRAAAKNHASVAVVTSPAQYPSLIASLATGGTTAVARQELAVEAFRCTATYDVAVATWLGSDSTEGVPGWIGATYRLSTPLRYGENPHQAAGLYVEESPVGAAIGALATAEQLGGKEMSYNNYQDTRAAVRAAFDHATPTVAIIKHANPCGIATAPSLADAYQAAFACDPQSAYGSVVAANRPVDLATAQKITPVFTEVVAAPSFTSEALELLRTKKNLRLLVVADSSEGSWEFTQISGGIIAQEVDQIDAEGVREDGTAFGDDVTHWQLVAGAAASPEILADLEFAWRSVRSVKSNAILLAKNGATIGVGMGQVNRVDSARLAVERANTLADGQNRTEGSVASSDAFFPFADGLGVLIDAGVTAVVAPGGSIRDTEVIAAAEAAGITLYFTGTRHFWH